MVWRSPRHVLVALAVAVPVVVAAVVVAVGVLVAVLVAAGALVEVDVHALALPPVIERDALLREDLVRVREADAREVAAVLVGGLGLHVLHDAELGRSLVPLAAVPLLLPLVVPHAGPLAQPLVPVALEPVAVLAVERRPALDLVVTELALDAVTIGNEEFAHRAAAALLEVAFVHVAVGAPLDAAAVLLVFAPLPLVHAHPLVVDGLAQPQRALAVAHAGLPLALVADEVGAVLAVPFALALGPLALVRVLLAALGRDVDGGAIAVHLALDHALLPALEVLRDLLRR
mmetsp:Transcript_54317/g.167139  ORF Transcript_54317/g.167139 Transcript_54317/m.167139 type:complete len:288 (-) Transcript_54317:820-1683(-)